MTLWSEKGGMIIMTKAVLMILIMLRKMYLYDSVMQCGNASFH